MFPAHNVAINLHLLKKADPSLMKYVLIVFVLNGIGNRNRKGKNGAAKSSVSGIGHKEQDELDVISQISIISSNTPKSFANNRRSSATKFNHIFSSGEWRRARLLEHPTLVMSLSVNEQDYIIFT